jgi:hypothetical protein
LATIFGDPELQAIRQKRAPILKKKKTGFNRKLKTIDLPPPAPVFQVPMPF